MSFHFDFFTHSLTTAHERILKAMRLSDALPNLN